MRSSATAPPQRPATQRSPRSPGTNTTARTPRMKACYLIDVCDPNGDMIDNLEISKATAM